MTFVSWSASFISEVSIQPVHSSAWTSMSWPCFWPMTLCSMTTSQMSWSKLKVCPQKLLLISRSGKWSRGYTVIVPVKKKKIIFLFSTEYNYTFCWSICSLSIQVILVAFAKGQVDTSKTSGTLERGGIQFQALIAALTCSSSGFLHNTKKCNIQMLQERKKER